MAERMKALISSDGDAAAETTSAPEAPSVETGAPEAPTEAPVVDEEAELRAKRKAILEEKLAEQRARSQARREAERLRAEREAAEADRQAAAAERSKWESARTDYRKAFQEMGLNPREVYEEMTRQAIEADTPEAKIKAAQAAWKAEMNALVEREVVPLRQTIEQLQAERARLQQQAKAHYVRNQFDSAIADPEYVNLRTEYDDGALLQYVNHFDENPESFYEAAKAYNVPLSRPGHGFSVREVLQVLKAAQDEHDRGREERRSKLAPRNESPAGHTAESPPATVNGTAARTNAATTITNDLASSRASSRGRRLSRQEKIDREIERLNRR